MQHNRRVRAISNLARLQRAARKPGHLNNDVVYLESHHKSGFFIELVEAATNALPL